MSINSYGQVLYKGKVMVEVEPYERCPFKIGILINNKVRFYRFQAEISFEEMTDPVNYQLPEYQYTDDFYPLFNSYYPYDDEE